MSNKTEKLLQRIAFRLPTEKYEKINSILEDGKYKKQSNFLRGAVDLLLFWENKLDIEEVTDSSLRKSIRDRFDKAEKLEKEFPGIRTKLRKDIELNKKLKTELIEMAEGMEERDRKKLEEIKANREEMRKDFDIQEKYDTELKKKSTKDAMKLILFFIKAMRDLYSTLDKPEEQLKVEEWATKHLVKADRLYDTLTFKEEFNKLSEKTSRRILMVLATQKMFTAKNILVLQELMESTEDESLKKQYKTDIDDFNKISEEIHSIMDEDL